MTAKTLNEKYSFLLSKLKVCHVDVCEQDALLQLKTDLYFQFSSEDTDRLLSHDLASVDLAVEQAMLDEEQVTKDTHEK